MGEALDSLLEYRPDHPLQQMRDDASSIVRWIESEEKQDLTWTGTPEHIHRALMAERIKRLGLGQMPTKEKAIVLRDALRLAVRAQMAIRKGCEKERTPCIVEGSMSSHIHIGK